MHVRQRLELVEKCRGEEDCVQVFKDFEQLMNLGEFTIIGYLLNVVNSLCLTKYNKRVLCLFNLHLASWMKF